MKIWRYAGSLYFASLSHKEYVYGLTDTRRHTTYLLTCHLASAVKIRRDRPLLVRLETPQPKRRRGGEKLIGVSMNWECLRSCVARATATININFDELVAIGWRGVMIFMDEVFYGWLFRILWCTSVFLLPDDRNGFCSIFGQLTTGCKTRSSGGAITF